MNDEKLCVLEKHLHMKHNALPLPFCEKIYFNIWSMVRKQFQNTFLKKKKEKKKQSFRNKWEFRAGREPIHWKIK